MRNERVAYELGATGLHRPLPFSFRPSFLRKTAPALSLCSVSIMDALGREIACPQVDELRALPVHSGLGAKSPKQSFRGKRGQRVSRSPRPHVPSYLRFAMLEQFLVVTRRSCRLRFLSRHNSVTAPRLSFPEKRNITLSADTRKRRRCTPEPSAFQFSWQRAAQQLSFCPLVGERRRNALLRSRKTSDQFLHG